RRFGRIAHLRASRPEPLAPAPITEIGRLPMTAEKNQNVQDVFLNHVRKNKTAVTVFLVNGVKLQGIITWFDNFCVLLRRDAHSQLVYKHAISTVMPAQPIQLFEGNREGEELRAAPTPLPQPLAPCGRTARPPSIPPPNYP